MAYKALDIANKIISKTDLEHGDTISNLKLQKMMNMIASYERGFLKGVAAKYESFYDISNGGYDDG